MGPAPAIEMRCSAQRSFPRFYRRPGSAAESQSHEASSRADLRGCQLVPASLRARRDKTSSNERIRRRGVAWLGFLLSIPRDHSIGSAVSSSARRLALLAKKLSFPAHAFLLIVLCVSAAAAAAPSSATNPISLCQIGRRNQKNNYDLQSNLLVTNPPSIMYQAPGKQEEMDRNRLLLGTWRGGRGRVQCRH